MYVGGAGLSQGYLNDPALTAERFIPNPFRATTGDRLYRTGDLGCYLPDGQLAFHGRMDDQIKIRGYRVELGEIEAVLAKHPHVREAVVAAHVDALGAEALLVGYVVPRENSPIVATEVRRWVRERLP